MKIEVHRFNSNYHVLINKTDVGNCKYAVADLFDVFQCVHFLICILNIKLRNYTDIMDVGDCFVIDLSA